MEDRVAAHESAAALSRRSRRPIRGGEARTLPL
jgi:hypothetical protein